MFEQESWQPVREAQALLTGEIHIWRTELEVTAERQTSLAKLLSTDERERAGRFLFDRHRRRYTVARGVLRRLLGMYLDLAPTTIEFAYSRYGKPTVVMEEPGPAFNVSHSHELALYVFAKRPRVGVDLEYARSLTYLPQLAERYFAPAEYQAWRSVQEGEQVQAFFNCWTRKEAFIKAIGEGLSYPLDRFEVTLVPGEPAALLTIDGSREAAGRWWLAAFDPGEKYAAAVVVEGAPGRLRLFDFKA